MSVLGCVISCMVAAIFGFIVAILFLSSHANGLEEECSRLIAENRWLRYGIENVIEYLNRPSEPVKSLIHQGIIDMLRKWL